MDVRSTGRSKQPRVRCHGYTEKADLIRREREYGGRNSIYQKLVNRSVVERAVLALEGGEGTGG